MREYCKGIVSNTVGWRHRKRLKAVGLGVGSLILGALTSDKALADHTGETSLLGGAYTSSSFG